MSKQRYFFFIYRKQKEYYGLYFKYNIKYKSFLTAPTSSYNHIRYHASYYCSVLI